MPRIARRQPMPQNGPLSWAKNLVHSITDPIARALTPQAPPPEYEDPATEPLAAPQAPPAPPAVMKAPAAPALHRVAAPPHPVAPAGQRRQQAGSVAIVYITASPTFTGAIAGYTTLGVPAAPKSTSQAPQVQSVSQDDGSNTQSRPIVYVTITSARASQTDSGPQTFSSVQQSSSAYVTPTGASTTVGSSSAQTSDSSSSSATAAASSGMSGGAKAGLAIGILLLIAAVLGGILFFLQKKKKQQRDEAWTRPDDEKRAFNGNAASSAPAGRAPRLSLRPVTQFFPAFGGARSNDNLSGAAKEPVGRKPIPTAGQQYNISRPSTANDPNNPFGNHAAASPTAAMMNVPSVTITSPDAVATYDQPMRNQYSPPQQQYQQPQYQQPQQPQQPQYANRAPAPDMNREMPAPPPAAAPVESAADASSHAATLGAAAAGTAAAAGLSAAVIAKRRSSRDPLSEMVKEDINKAVVEQETQYSPSEDSSDMRSPTESQSSSESPVLAGAVPHDASQNGAPKPVHRVHLDYKPEMQDELELRAGQLVRLVHEFDDGWAMCIRLDRSQQGVCPRTCLSARPVKPRNPNQGPPPPGGPGGPGGPGARRGPPPPGMRGPPPQGGPGGYGRNSPGPGGRPPMNPNSGRNSPAGDYGRSQSPAGSYRSQSPSGPRNGPNRGPPGPSRMGPGGPPRNGPGPQQRYPPNGQAPHPSAY